MTTLSVAKPQPQSPSLTPTIIMGLIVAFIMSLLLGLPGPLALILGAQLVALFMVGKRKVWIVASILVGQLTASNYVIYVSNTQVSLRFIWTVIAGVMLLYLVLTTRRTILGKQGWRVFTPALILFAWALLSDMVNTDFSYTMQYARVVSTSVVILALVPAVVEEEKDLKILGLVALVTCSVSALFAVMQHYHFNFLPMSATIFGSASINGRRAIGLNDSAVDLSFTLPLILLPMITLLFFKAINRRYLTLTVLLTLLILAAEYYSFTRSGMYALGAGMFTLILFMRSKHKARWLFVALAITGAFLIYVNAKGNRYSEGVSNESSAAGRLVLWQAGAQIAMNSPVIGIGGRDFETVSAQYMNNVTSNLNVVTPEDVLGVEQPHNDFIRIWVSYGTPALLAFLWMLFAIGINFLHSYHKNKGFFMKALSLGLFAAFATYIINAAMHNVIDEVSLLWIVGGLSIACARFADRKRRVPVRGKA